MASSAAAGTTMDSFSQASVQGADHSAFMKLWESRCDTSLVTVTGFDRRSIEYLLGVPTEDIVDVEAFQQNKFERLFNRYSSTPQNGQFRERRHQTPREMTALQCLAMVLTWTRTQGPTFTLAVVFGVLPSVCDTFLQFGRCVLLRVLVEDERAKIRLPSSEQIAQYKEAVKEKFPKLEGACLFAGYLKIPIDRPSDAKTQRQFYDISTNAYNIANVLVFAPDGKIVAFAGNFPGESQDSLVVEW